MGADAAEYQPHNKHKWVVLQFPSAGWDYISPGFGSPAGTIALR